MFRVFFLLLFLLFGIFSVYAQGVELFLPIDNVEHRTKSNLKKFDLDFTKFSQIQNLDNVTIQLPDLEGFLVTKVFKKVDLKTNDFQILLSDRVKTESSATKKVYKSDHNDLMVMDRDGIWFRFVKGGVSLSLMKEDIYYTLKESEQPDKQLFCGVPDQEYVLPGSQIKVQSRTSTDTLGIAIDLDYESYSGLGSDLTIAENYVIDLFAQVYNYYDMINVPIKISQLTIWDTPDPFASTDCLGLLSDYENYRTNNAYNGNFTHLLAWTNSINCSGIAKVNVICADPGERVGFTAMLSNEPTIPTVSINAQTMTHELGHNLGSGHTHACIWNGNNTQIDDCGNFNFLNSEGEQGGCYVPGSSTPIIPTNGTIMSYCNSIDVNNPWNSQVVSIIQFNYDNRDCSAPDLQIYTGQFGGGFSFDVVNNIVSYSNLGVFNSGFGDANNPGWSLYMSQDMNYSTDDVKIDDVNYNTSLPAGFAIFSTHSINLGTNLYEEGDYYFIAVADDQGTIAELDENNNTEVFGPFFVDGYTCNGLFANLSGVIPSNNYNYLDSIHSDGTVEVDSNVTFTAGQSIVLKPGFHAKAGSAFIAQIGTCEPQSTNLQSTSEEIMMAYTYQDPSENYTLLNIRESVKETEHPRAENQENEGTTEFSIKLFPNPANEYLGIIPKYSGNAEVQLIIFDTRGRQVWQQVALGSSQQIGVNLTNFSSGMYFVQMRSQKENIVEKLVVIK